MKSPIKLMGGPGKGRTAPAKPMKRQIIEPINSSVSVILIARFRIYFKTFLILHEVNKIRFMKKYLAQLNISRIIPETMEDPIMADFVAQLDTINALAESSKGFVWRLKGDDNNATNFRPFDDDRVIVNMSVWESAEELMEFVYKSAHTMVMKDRNKWFEKFGKPSMVLWNVEEGHIPTVQEARERLEYFQANGATEFAFDFKNRF